MQLGHAAKEVRRRLVETVAHSPFVLYENLFQRNFYAHAYDEVSRWSGRLAQDSSAAVKKEHSLRRMLAKTVDDNEAEHPRLQIELDEVVNTKTDPLGVHKHRMNYAIPRGTKHGLFRAGDLGVLHRRILQMLRLGMHPMADFGVYDSDHPIHDDYWTPDDMQTHGHAGDEINLQYSSQKNELQQSSGRRLMSDTLFADSDSDDKLNTVIDPFAALLDEHGMDTSSIAEPSAEQGLTGSPRRRLSLTGRKNKKFLLRLEELLATRAPAQISHKQLRRLEERDAARRLGVMYSTETERDSDYSENSDYFDGVTDGRRAVHIDDDLGIGDRDGRGKRRLTAQSISAECTGSASQC
jgi:hypothetical protein